MVKRKLSLVRRANNFIAQENGRQFERTYYSVAKATGKEINRTSRGSDWKERPTDPLTGKGIGKFVLVENKTGNAKTSRLQNKTRKKVGKKNYNIVRPWSL